MLSKPGQEAGFCLVLVTQCMKLLEIQICGKLHDTRDPRTCHAMALPRVLL